jgi:hypothetical protein
MKDQPSVESGNAEPAARQILLADLEAQPDVHQHIAIAWGRLADNGRTSATNRITVLRPFAL